jgi:beta-lactamase regulating signal transducer with metallopeptidase domain
MSATTRGVDQPRANSPYENRATAVRRSTETKASFKTTEFVAYIAILVAIFVAGAATKAGSNGNDVFQAHQVWLYATILSIGYMISRGLAKAGSRERYTDER